MIKIVKKIAFEPLFHFLVVGFVLYLFYNTDSVEQVKETKIVEISVQELQKIKSQYKEEFNKEMNAEELEAFKKKKYYEKILLNEAYSLGLEKQDELISKRLLEQMQQIMVNSSVVAEPSEAELYEYYKKNRDEYSNIITLSFSQIYFSNPKNEGIETILHALQLADVNATLASSFGEVSPVPNQIKNIGFSELEEMYGKYFASKVFNLKSGVWHKPILSKYGAHVVYVKDKNVSDAYIFDEVQERVYADYLEEERKKREDEAYKKISSQYSLEVK
jgi:hypothetical protein